MTLRAVVRPSGRVLNLPAQIREVITLVLVKHRFTVCVTAAIGLIAGFFAPARAAQGPSPAKRTFTLEQAIDFGLKNYPAVRAALEQVGAARGGVELARTSYLPRTDLLWQSNRATRNNIFGLVLPQAVVPAISGPVLASTSNGSVWGSAAGLLFSWEPFDFGYRRAGVQAARATESRTSAEVGLTELDVAVAVTDAFTGLLAAQERTRAAEADVQRRRVFAESVGVLVKNELRPGADASRAEAELAGARIQLVQAQAGEQVARVTLAQVLGIAGTEVQADPADAGRLLGPSPGEPLPEAPVTSHPLAEVEKARVDEAAARVRVFERQYYPRFNFQSAVSGRGTGANLDGTFAGGTNGLGLERSNWGLGLTVTFPLFDFASIHARKRIELSNERSQAARYDQTVQDLTGQQARARAIWDGARRVAENTPVELRAARDTEAQARARYQAGLATLVDVADAQRLLVQAEIDDAVARLNVWRGLASIAAAQGNLEPFMQLLRKKTPGGP